ncbi:beta-lactamase-like protein [Spinellus fusiger]|nr:beta-lactamase-like protein [Spinellus fusiger]
MATLLKIIFLGTGTSGGIPNISCLTEPEKDCSVCQSSVTVAGKKNRRRNTSLIVHTLEFFPQYGLRELDGVILTHGHADAVFGLDDLRQWTLHGAVQTKIDIYLCSDTMSTVSTTFPYLVDSQKATGGGDVASFQYHIINANQNFTIHGLNFTPLVVHHGIYFTTHLPYHCYGFHFGGVSYFSDTNYIPPETMERIKGKTQVLVLDCLYGKP